MTDLNDLFKAVSKAKQEQKVIQESTPAAKALKGVQDRLKSNNDVAELMEVFVEKKPIVKEVIREVVVEVEKPAPKADSFQQPNPPLVDQNIAAIQQKLKFLEQAIGKIAAAGPGSGEVNLRWLDDVDRNTIQDNRYLRYNASSKKFIFDDVDSVGEYLTFWDTSSHTIPQSVHFLLEMNTTNGSRNISLVDSSKVTFTKDGTYNLHYSLQIVNTGNEQEDLHIWIKKNGVNVEDTNSIFTVPARKNPATTGKMIATSPIPIDVVAGDYIQVYLHTEATTLQIDTVNEDSAHNIPRSPSAILVVSKL